MNADASYQLGQFRDNDGALDRLKRQASTVNDIEMACVARAGLRTGLRVLDAGCGPGLISSQIAKRFQPSRLTAVDCNDVSVAETGRVFDREGIAGSVHKANLYEPALAALGPFDFIYSRFVFQHLSQPLPALLNVQQSLAPGGRLCVCDVDDRWMTFTPDVPQRESFLDRVYQAQRGRGGDRHVGGKLAHYLKEAGFVNLRTETLLISTDLIGKEAFMDLVFGYKLEVIDAADLDLSRAECQAVKTTLDSPAGWAGLALFFVSGEKS